MSFLDDILDVGKGVWDMLTGPGVGAGIARATALSYLLKEVTDSTKKENTVPEQARPEAATTPDYGVREQVDPNTEHSIPVVYGTAFLGGVVTDAVLTNSNQTMWYCLAICEKTGNLIDGTPSALTFENIYWNQNKVIFQSDGVTVSSFQDEDGIISTKPNGLIKIYCFNNGSTGPIVPTGYANGSLQNAYNIFPNWTVNHTMENLVFALIRVDYNKEKEVTGLGNIEFKMKNSMSQPGDVINDYLTNTRYGAGIAVEEIYSV